MTSDIMLFVIMLLTRVTQTALRAGYLLAARMTLEARRRGAFDQINNAVYLHAVAENHDEGLLDFAAVHTFINDKKFLFKPIFKDSRKNDDPARFFRMFGVLVS